MASTRNKNTPGDYYVQQKSYIQQVQYSTNREYAIASPTLLAGSGLIQGRVPDTELAGNPNDIESFLFGIGSTNLVNPQAPVKPDIKKLNTLSIVDRKVPLIMPRDLIIEGDQRPFPVPN